MAKRVVPVTFGFGLRDRIDPKLAPFGVLKVGKNLRVRKDGRLGVRRGYWPIDVDTANGELYAHDLHEYRSRLLALGSDAGDTFATDLFEYTGAPSDTPWRGCDPTGTRVVLNPFTDMREVAGLPQPAEGASNYDAAIGGWYLCVFYNVGLNPVDAYAVVIDRRTDQVIHYQHFSSVNLGSARVVYAGTTFYIAGLNGPANVVVHEFTPGVSSEFTPFLTDSSLFGVSAWDMCTVVNATTARIAVAIDRQSGQDLTAKVYDAAGAQVGSTVTVAGTATSFMGIAVDQTHGSINLYTVEGGAGFLRTFSFGGVLLDGPTATTSGTTGALCHLQAQTGFDEHLAVAVNDGSSNIVVQFFDIDTHAVTDTATIQHARLTTKPVAAQSVNQPMAIALGAVLGTDPSELEGLTNALFFLTPDSAHMVTRDLRKARRDGFYSMSRAAEDGTSGTLCWPAVRDPGDGAARPAIVTVECQNPARRESVQFGGLLYFAGATPSVYDGRFPVPLNFGEFPGIVSLTPSASSGSLASEATYTYVAHWEYVLADGSIMIGPVSDPVQVATGASDQRVTASVTTPHTLAIAMGDALYGANVTAVLSRTDWNSTARVEGSVFRRSTVEPITVGMANYGDPLTIVDRTSDADIADEAPVYTQAERGPVSAPLQHFAPLSCSYLTATESRLFAGGLPRDAELQISKAAYIGEAFEFSPLSQYFAVVANAVRGVRHIDGAKLVFTADRIYAIPGDGPDDIGVGFLEYPREIPSPSGLSNAWSFLDAPDGLWFQVDETKLFRLPRAGGAPTWEGVDVQDTLATYPNITGTAKCRFDNTARFACNSNSGDAVLLVRDLRTEQWFVDEVPLEGALRITAITGWGETVAYAAGGRVWYQQPLAINTWDVALPDTQVFIETELRTHPLYPFGLGGYGQIYDMMITGEALGACVLNCRVSYDDGVSFTDLESFEMVDITLGTVQRKWTLPQDVTSSVVFEFTVTQYNSEVNEGFAFNQIDLLVEPEDGLRELKPTEVA